MKRLMAFVAALLAAFSPIAYAHTMVQSVTIADRSTLRAPPENISITFEHAASFGSARLTTATGEVIPLTYTPPRGASRTFTIPLPRLDPDRYRFTWRVIAEDGHVMSGGVMFTVAPPSAQ